MTEYTRGYRVCESLHRQGYLWTALIQMQKPLAQKGNPGDVYA